MIPIRERKKGVNYGLKFFVNFSNLKQGDALFFPSDMVLKEMVLFRIN